MSAHRPRPHGKDKASATEMQRRKEERNEQERRKAEKLYENTTDVLDPAARKRRDSLKHTSVDLARQIQESGGASAAGRELRTVEQSGTSHNDHTGAPQEPGSDSQYSVVQFNQHVVDAAQRQSAEANAHPGLREQGRTNRYRLTAGLVVGTLAGTIIGAGGLALTLFLLGIFKASQPASKPDPEPDPELGPDYDPTMRNIIDEWRALPEAEFWKAVISWLQEERRSPAMQLDSISFLRSIAEWQDTYSDLFILDSVKSLLQEWERAGVNETGGLTDEAEIARDVALYKKISVLSGDATNPGELSRFWKLRILEYVLALIVTPVRLVDNQNDRNTPTERFSTVGDWTEDTSPVDLNSGTHFASTGSEGRIARFSIDQLIPGDYIVSATWRVRRTNTRDAKYQILDTIGGNLLGAATINQRILPDDFDDFGSTWKRLATVKVAGDTLVVELSDSANGIVFADAVHIKRTVQLPPNTPDD